MNNNREEFNKEKEWAIEYLEDLGNTWEPEDGYPALTVLERVRSGKVTDFSKDNLDELVIEERKRMQANWKPWGV